MITTSKI